MRLMDNEAVRF